MDAAVAAPPVDDPPVAAPVDGRTKLFYGLGAIAYGIKDNGFSVFLLLFYNQVIGLDARAVGLVILIALVADAFIDPLIGHWSDRTRSRWGRRHPWMYASAVPIALAWLLLWNPPAVSDGLTLAYLLAVAIFVRASLSLYEVPSIALAPEISRDYHERTAIIGWRYVFGWAGGLVMLALAYQVLLVPSPGHSVGQLNPVGYSRFALVGAVGMVLAVLISAVGTHRAYARPTFDADAGGHVPSFADIGPAVRFRPFRLLMGALLFAFASQGLTFALSNYLLLFVFGVPQAAFALYAVALFGGVLLSVVLAARVGRRLGKPRAASVLTVGAVVVGTAPYWLAVAHALPSVADPLVLTVLLVDLGVGIGCGIAAILLGASMMADVTDAAHASTGRREEGLFYAGYFFMQKCVTGLGIFLSGLLLAAIGFPDGAVPGTVPGPVIDRLALFYALGVTVLGLAAAGAFTLFPLRAPEPPGPPTR